MNRQRIALVVAVIATLSFLVTLAFVASPERWKQGNHDSVNAPQILAAVERFRNERQMKGQPFPAEVSLETLISAGYLRSEDVRGFNGVEVTFTTAIPRDDRPQSILAQARLPDGTVEAVLNDGSVKAVKR